MDRTHQRETDRESADPVANSDAQRQTHNSAGGVSFEPEIFIGDVINMVNDMTVDGFDSMEEFVTRKLNLKSENSRQVLKQGVDSIYGKVQDNLDESFNRWETVCRDRYFKDFRPKPSTSSSSEKTTGNASQNCSKASSAEDGQEEALDSELRSLRSQLVAAQREGVKMRRELTSMEKQLAVRRRALSDAKSVEESFDGDVLAEVITSASHLQDSILKARSMQEKKSCLHTGTQAIRNCPAGAQSLSFESSSQFSSKDSISFERALTGRANFLPDEAVSYGDSGSGRNEFVRLTAGRDSR